MLSRVLGRTLTYKFHVRKPRDNLTTRPWARDKVIARIFLKSDHTESSPNFGIFFAQIQVFAVLWLSSAGLNPFLIFPM
jgi:hypothetical protein